ncbi:MAG: molecular chaperone HtpG [Bacteroidaceae bacterium]|nr:molecular chaperone HtpG [Bacteroidaceae bacterium]
MKGNIGITTENIFPVIKKFLYSDHEIFLRELVSNGVDAVQKLNTLVSKGEFKGDASQLSVKITMDEKAHTLTISDNGIGMTAEEVDKYINQIAFSGATDFLEKYKDDAAAIIGHFGLGFYSAFMVAKEVEIFSLSYQEGAEAVHWSCDGSPAYEMKACDKKERGTDIVLHLDDDCQEFSQKNRVLELLRKYCRFLPVPVQVGMKTEWKDGKEVETDEPNIINDTTPLWTKQPSTLQDEDYKKFYRDLYPMSDEPLFWIHLNVDYPFHLTGVLYFPRIKSNIEIHRNRIGLYCNQVYVTDQVENIVPEFLTLLHGVIDSPDIPLNVSRSYLQSDQNVKKIASYIEKKVADRLSAIFKENRSDFEQKWNDLKLFIHYGMLSQEKFYDRASKFALLQDVDGKSYTYDEYRDLIKGEQTDKDGTLVYLYATNRDEQYTYIEAARNKGYNVLLMDGQLDTPLVGMLEQKFEKARFSRVDGDTIERLIVKTDGQEVSLSADETHRLTEAFKSKLPQLDKKEFTVNVEAMGETASPVVLTQSEYMRRMKDMSQYQQGMAFYGEMPDMYQLVLNADHPTVKNVLSAMPADELAQIEGEVRGLKARKAAIEDTLKNKKEADLTDDEKRQKTEAAEALTAQEKKLNERLAAIAEESTAIPQLIDLALLQNGLLKGEALARFIQRSVAFVK